MGNLTNETEKKFRGYDTEKFSCNEERTHQGYILGGNDTGWSPLRYVHTCTCAHMCVHTHTHSVTYKGEKQKASWPQTSSQSHSVAEDNGVVSTTFWGKKSMTQEYNTQPRYHSNIKSLGRHS